MQPTNALMEFREIEIEKKTVPGIKVFQIGFNAKQRQKIANK